MGFFPNSETRSVDFSFFGREDDRNFPQPENEKTFVLVSIVRFRILEKNVKIPHTPWHLHGPQALL